MQCGNNLKQTGLALHLYHETHAKFPSGMSVDLKNGSNNYSWAWSAVILPYMEQTNVLEQMQFAAGYNVHQNAAAGKMFVTTYLCPSAAPPKLVTACCSDFLASGVPLGLAVTNYAGIETDLQRDYYLGGTTQGSGCLYTNSGIGLADIPDGSSQTLLVGERDHFPDDDPWKPVHGSICGGLACELGDHWPGNARMTTGWGVNNPNARFYQQSSVQSGHSGGASFVFADGHVSFLGDSINQAALRSLTTRNSISEDGVTRDIITSVDN
jgi:prepilin-type processing-associated H-X9-DG protein